jgi:antirestriction protein
MKLILNKLTKQVIAKTTDDNYIALEENHEVINAPIAHKIEDDITALFWDGEKLYQGEVDENGEFLEGKIIMAKQWRNNELRDTDWIVSITDHSEHQQYLDYRQLLRDWTDTDNFPNTKPIKQ